MQTIQQTGKGKPVCVIAYNEMGNGYWTYGIKGQMRTPMIKRAAQNPETLGDY
jgi:hypothetical protein